MSRNLKFTLAAVLGLFIVGPLWKGLEIAFNPPPKGVFYRFVKAAIDAQKIEDIQPFFTTDKQKINLRPMAYFLAQYKMLAALNWQISDQRTGTDTSYVDLNSTDNLISNLTRDPLTMKVIFKREDRKWKWSSEYIPSGKSNDRLILMLENLKENSGMESELLGKNYPKTPQDVCKIYLEKIHGHEKPDNILMYFAGERKNLFKKLGPRSKDLLSFLNSLNLSTVKIQLGTETAYVTMKVNPSKTDQAETLQIILKKIGGRWKVFDETSDSHRLENKLQELKKVAD